MTRELEKLNFSLGGIRDMHGLPQLIFVVDIKREDIAVNEAKCLDIPVVALVDTNCNPSEVDYAIPSNDDGTRAIRIFCQAMADAVNEGRELYKAKPPKVDAEETTKAKKEEKTEEENSEASDS